MKQLDLLLLHPPIYHEQLDHLLLLLLLRAVS